MLDAVDATEIVFAVGTHGSAGLAVQRPAGVVVRDDRGVEIEDVERAIRTEGDVDRTEPMVQRAEPLAVLEGDFAEEGRASGDELLEVDDVQNRLGDEDGVAILLRPGSMFLHGHGTGGGVVTDLVDLQQRSPVRQVFTQDGAARVDGVEGLGRRTRGLGEDGLRKHDVLDRIAGRRLTMEEFHVGSDLVAEAVAAL